MTKKYEWKKQSDEIEEILESGADVSWTPDPSGYFLIRVNNDRKRIEVAFVTNEHQIKKVIYGDNAIDIYHTISKNKLITRFEHAAYLGKELYKAELCLKYGKNYVQEGNLSFGNEKVELSGNS